MGGRRVGVFSICAWEQRLMNTSKHGLWWPEFESGYQDVEDYIIHRVNDADIATKHVRTKGVCVQAGGHVGLFPRQLAKHFSFVHTFEPGSEMFAALVHNTEKYANIISHNYALGPTSSMVPFEHRRSGRSKVNIGGNPLQTVRQEQLDSLNLPRCDLIYLDVEGYELEVLKGAAETIKKFQPIITLEVLKGREDATTDYMGALGYNRIDRVHSDWTFST